MKNLKPTSSYFLNSIFWRYLRRLLNGKTWTLLYKINQKIKLFELKKLVENQNFELKNNLVKSNNLSEGAKFNKKLSEYLIENESVKPRGDYLKYLDEVLIKIQDKKNFILEIGIAQGSGIVSLKEFFYKSKVFGFDIDPATFIDEKRIECHFFDQLNLEKSKKTMEKLGIGFDLIIDDGWHHPEAQIKTLCACLPYLNYNGIYIIEDIVSSDYKNFFNQISEILEKKNFICKNYDFFPEHKINDYGMTGVLEITRKNI